MLPHTLYMLNIFPGHIASRPTGGGFSMSMDTCGIVRGTKYGIMGTILKLRQSAYLELLYCMIQVQCLVPETLTAIPCMSRP